VSNAANIAFFDKKTGDQLQSKNGEPTKLSTTEFFLDVCYRNARGRFT
jgi:hypothetical protein